ncbi:hypothetical protein [Flagellimonas lutaonensis]|nr:hypothetical protein [Allomuricauda lutaonensis]
MKKTLIILLSISILSCTEEKKGFPDYLKSLYDLELPLSFDLNSRMDASKNYDSTLFETYKHVWTYAPYGIAFKNDKVVGVIEYSITDNGLAPFLITLDNQGNKIDSLNILGNTRFGKQGQTLESAVLYADLKLVVTDSSRSWLIDYDYNKIPNTTELRVTTTTYQILENGKIEQIDKSEPIITKPDTKSEAELLGVYEYVHEYNTEDLIENHYLEFKEGQSFYYGTSDDFDEAREGYYPGFFKAQIDNLEFNGENLTFDITVSDSIFYKKPVTPLYQTIGNEPWDIGIRYNTRNYQGIVNGDTITILTKEFDPRKFIKKKVADTAYGK